MRITLVGTLTGLGGIQRHLTWLAQCLGEEGVQTLALSLENQKNSHPDIHQLQKLSRLGVSVIHCIPYDKNKLCLGFSRLKRLGEITAIIDSFSPDVYLAVGTGWNLFIPPLLSRVKTRRIFYEVMSGVPSGWSDSRWAVRSWFDEVIGQSPTVANTFAKYFSWQKPISAIPAIPEPLELTATLPQPVIKTVELGKAKAGLFSRLVPHKQAFWLVQQWDLLKDVLAELHIHGTGSEEQLIRDYIDSQGIGDRVKCFGRYPEDQAYVDLLSSYDLTLLPTIGAEGAPLVLLESMACGVTFVAYGVGGIPDYAIDNPNVLVVSPEPKAFVSGVRQMAHRLANGQINQVELQQFYLKHYSYTVLKKAWLSYLCP
ncbi:glycosyltransferase [Aetokthonos hydrillicola Thurmond2011]|jgi:glycosyltransferase involved in cell wall biosynthesis|uniref:Glycosyltransferase n=1 Tax=Aetokthonos hydrillicola Thurmond2011 TaxID=2712845 RepID=A0AAP5I3Z6_9CYAN|nr:glycosyltransferase [Aetokthonos hydrillicola]MBO3459254.1 glycosyltransferase [Aetokthonos hydrillicola CCALA 1050]MBW4584912.1 glycosyltransferase [Aetokthonos hydrillicola CCALA 1050]MDR9894329.1 glycosyltransferase [Aetokthonos hydrillicola Thurmond2011]